jgi:hypothetical protein
MTPIRTMGACLVAALALSAVAAAGASAEDPEFGRCLAKVGGKFENSGCTLVAKEASKQKFEWTAVILKNKFNGHMSTGIATLETVAGTKITCTAESNKGAEFTGPKTVGALVAKFTGCETGGLKCNSAGNAPGAIDTAVLEGELGVEKQGATDLTDTLAVVLFGPKHGNLAEFECTAAVKVITKGGVIHPVTKNKMLLTSTEKFVASKGEQKPDKFVGGPVDEHILESNTNGGAFEEAGQTITALIESEKS